MAVVADTGTTAACSNVRRAGFRTSLSARRRCVLGKGTFGDAEHLVTDLELGDIRADLDHRPGDVLTEYGILRPTEPEAEYSHQVRLAPHEVRGAAIDPGCTHLHEHVARSEGRLLDARRDEGLPAARRRLAESLSRVPPSAGVSIVHSTDQRLASIMCLATAMPGGHRVLSLDVEMMIRISIPT